MEKQEILVRSHLNRSDVQRTLEAWAAPQDATVRPMDRLVRHYKTEGENMHWHISGTHKGMGTVEVTYIPSS